MRPQPRIGPRNPATHPAYINHTSPERERDFRLLEEVGGGGSRVGEKQGTPRRNPSTACALPGHLVALGPRTISSSRESLVIRGEWAPADLCPPPPAVLPAWMAPAQRQTDNGRVLLRPGDSRGSPGGSGSRRMSRHKADVSLRNVGHDCFCV